MRQWGIVSNGIFAINMYVRSFWSSWHENSMHFVSIPKHFRKKFVQLRFLAYKGLKYCLNQVICMFWFLWQKQAPIVMIFLNFCFFFFFFFGQALLDDWMARWPGELHCNLVIWMVNGVCEWVSEFRPHVH